MELNGMSDEQPPKKKILILTSTFPRWENDTLPPFVYELSRRLTDQFEVHLSAPAFPGAKKYEMMDGIHVHRFRYFFRRWERLAGSDGIIPTIQRNRAYLLLVPLFLLGQYLAARRLIKKNRPAVAHAHWIVPQGLIVRLLSLTTPVHYIVTSHGGDIFGLQGKVMTRLKRWVLKKAQCTTVVSNAIKREVVQNLDSNLPLSVIPMGVDSTLFSPNRQNSALRQKHQIEGPFLLFVGRLVETKGVQYLLEAMRTVLKTHPNTKLMIVGRGPWEAKLKSQAQALGIESQILFMGAIPNNQLPQYYATADLFIAPSIQTQEGSEGFGLTLVEAGMSGAWLIGSDIGGVGDIIQEGKNGNLIEERNVEQLAETILHALERELPPLSERLESFQPFDWEVIAERYAEALRKAV